MEFGKECRQLDLEIRDDGNVEMQTDMDVVPKSEMFFNTVDDALEFYKTYAKKKGFGVARSSSKKKGGMTRYLNFACHKGGKPRNVSTCNPTTKTNCLAKMIIARQVDDKWKVTKVVLEHNHVLDPEKSKYLNCYRNETKVNQANDSYERMADENQQRTWIVEDGYNHMNPVRRHKLEGGDASAMLMYFHRLQVENKDFFYATVGDSENRLTRAFWADARSRESYKEFGDVVTFDTTYLVNKHDLPFALFVGVNHHGKSILFGCGFLSREDTESFVWLFKTWLRCMKGIPPNAIITDQDMAMTIAIGEVFPNIKHRWCLWHIMGKIPEKFKSREDIEKIRNAIGKAVYDSLVMLEFEVSWAELVDEFKLENDVWLKTLYDGRSLWVPAFVKDTFWAGMSTTQRSENVHSFFDKYIGPRTTFIEFAEQYENALRGKAEKEHKADYSSLDSEYRALSPYGFEKQFFEAYTVNKFEQIKNQIFQLIGCELVASNVVDGIEHYVVEHTFETDLEPIIEKSVNYDVAFNPITGETNCICRLFESKGLVCVHMMAIWKRKNPFVVPKRYILQRWQKNVVRCHTKVRTTYTDGLPRGRNYDRLKKGFDKLVDEVIFSDEKTRKIEFIIAQLTEEMKQSCRVESGGPILVSSVGPQFVSPSVGQSHDVGDPSEIPKKGRPQKLRNISRYDKETTKKMKINKNHTEENSAQVKVMGTYVMLPGMSENEVWLSEQATHMSKSVSNFEQAQVQPEPVNNDSGTIQHFQ